MPAVKMSLAQYQKWLGHVMDDVEEAAIRGIRAGAKRAAVLTQERARLAPAASARGSVGAFNTGAYVRSIKSEKISKGAQVYSDKPYASVIEHGRRAGAKRPPKRAIAQWAQRKLGLSREEADAAAFAMARAISKRGLRPRNVFKDAFDDMVDVVLKEMMLEVDRELAK